MLNFKEYTNLMGSTLHASNDVQCGHKDYREVQIVEDGMFHIIVTDGYNYLTVRYSETLDKAKIVAEKLLKEYSK